MTLKQAIGICSKTNYRVIYTGTCIFCKSTFFYSYALERRQGFCSHTCASRFNFSKSSITFKCFNCKKIVVRAKSHYTRRKTNFCNFKCWTNYSQNNFPNRKNGTINNWGYRLTKPLKEFECRICKAIFKGRNRKDRPNYYCSRKCLYLTY